MRMMRPVRAGRSLSANLKEMERGELQNYRMLRRERRIGFGLYAAASFFSLLKYVRRRLRAAGRRDRAAPPTTTERKEWLWIRFVWL